MKKVPEMFAQDLDKGDWASIYRGKLVFGSSANRADPVSGQVFKRSIRGNLVVRVAFGRIINVAANLALIFLHDVLLKWWLAALGPASTLYIIYRITSESTKFSWKEMRNSLVHKLFVVDNPFRFL
jgi:hypothetical protein